MFLVDNPLGALFIAVGVLIFFLLLFKFLNFLENYKAKSKKTKEKSEPKKDASAEKTEEKESKETPKKSSNSNYDNYLYDRFVTSPTSDDYNPSERISKAFLKDKEYTDIKNNKVKIDITPIKEPITFKSYEMNKKMQEIFKENRTKEQILNDFNSMPREMKLMILENILNKME